MEPRVSVVIPARNEHAHIEACIRSVLSQAIDGGVEVIVADGCSGDGTAELARTAGARVVENPGKGAPSGLNAALAVARGEVIVRFDAHAEMPPGYIEACVRALTDEPGAVNVGGWREIRGSGPLGRAIGAAYESRFGIGNARIWRRPNGPPGRRTDVDTVPLGCWPADVLRAVGGWNESHPRHEDFELNYRLRERGGRVIFDEAIFSIYYPRTSLRALALQHWNYGRVKAKMLAENPTSIRPRQLAPVGLAVAVMAAPLPSRVGRIARRGLAAYALTLAAVTVRSRGGWRTAPVLATIHFSWAGGLLRGLLGAADDESD